MTVNFFSSKNTLNHQFLYPNPPSFIVIQYNTQINPRKEKNLFFYYSRTQTPTPMNDIFYDDNLLNEKYNNSYKNSDIDITQFVKNTGIETSNNFKCSINF